MSTVFAYVCAMSLSNNTELYIIWRGTGVYSRRYPVRISFRQTLENMDFDEDSYTCSSILALESTSLSSLSIRVITFLFGPIIFVY